MALTAIALVAFTLYTWNIGYSGLSTYYASAAKSMSGSGRALFFGTLNPSATVTLDKLSGFLVPQALAAHLFGFSAFALSLPQAIEGVVTIVASYAIGARWRGARFGLTLAALMAFTPMLSAMFGRPMEDGMLTMCMVLSFSAMQRAASGDRILWLFVAFAWVAIGFQAKMLQAWLLLPSLVVLWLAGSTLRLRARVLWLAAGLLTCVALSVSWMTAIQLVPWRDRPFIDGTTNNNIFSMVFGYNGVDRIIPGIIPGAVPQLDRGHLHVVNATATSIAGHSPLKLLMPEFTTQIGWLLPLAILGLILELAAVFSRRTREQLPSAIRSGVVPIGLTVWLLVPTVVLSVAFVPHATYFAELALPVSALALAGASRALVFYRGLERRRVVLPLVVAGQTAWIAWVVQSAPPVMHFLLVPVLVLGIVSAAALSFFGLNRSTTPHRSRFVTAALGLAAVGILIAPVAWSLCVIGPGGGGSASDAFAGPRIVPAHRTLVAAGAKPRGRPSLRPPFGAPPNPALDRQQRRLLQFLVPRDRAYRWLFATDSMPIAVTFLLETRYDAFPVGGFSRRVPNAVTVENRIVAGQLRFVLLNRDGVADQTVNAATTQFRHWVRNSCEPVLSGRFHSTSRLRQDLFDCGRVMLKGAQVRD